MKPKEIKTLTAILKAIADPTRRAIFDLVLNGTAKHSISTVSKEFKITRQGVTKHLKMLEAAKLIELKRIGRVTYCNADKTPLNKVKDWMAQYISTGSGLGEIPVLSEKELKEVEQLVTNTEQLIENIEAKEKKIESPKAQLLQMSIDPNDPGSPVVAEPPKPEPAVKEPKEKPIEVTDNQLDIYGIRKEPKVNKDSQLEMF